MIMKSLLAAAAVAAAAFTVSAPANAKVNIDVYLGGGGYGYVPSYGYYEPAYPIYRAPRHHRRAWDYEPAPRPRYVGISCEEGRDKVDWSGFNRVRTVECSGSSYTYRALRHGKGYVVKVSRRHGDIISVDRSW